jgi:hypothetical protein
MAAKKRNKRIGALDLVKFLAVLDFAICTKEPKANLQWKRYGWRWWQSHSMPCDVLGSAGIDGEW